MDSISMNLAVAVKPITRTLLMFELKIIPNFEFVDLPINVVVEDRDTVDTEVVQSQFFFILKKQYVGETTTLNFPVAIHGSLPREFIVEIHNFLHCFIGHP